MQRLRGFRIDRGIWRAIVAQILVVGLLVGISAPVLAIDDPDTPPQVTAVYVYEGLLATGDAGVLIDYYLDYDPAPGIPDETVTQAYLAIFIDTDGTTQLKAVAPYAFVDSGYGRGLVWIYFTAAEVTSYSLDSANIASYRVWLAGNPALSWAGVPPKTIASIDQWNTTGDMATLLTLRVLYYAGLLEDIWSPLDLVETTSIGSRLTTTGESYFENAIANLRIMASACFAASTIEPTLEDIDYTTRFGATMTDGTGIVAGSPITLAEGANTVTVTGLGTFTIILEQGTVGTVSDGTGVVTGSPVDLVAGTNTITTTGLGNLTVTVNLQDTTTGIDDATVGTGWDLTTVAATFGMSRWMFSGIVWFIISILICAAVFKGTPDQYGGANNAGKILFPVFIICIVGGTLLGLLKPVVGILMFIGIAGFFVGYVLFFRGANA